LSATIDQGKIEALFEKDVLKVTLPHQPVEQTVAKKITIKAV
jgi:HSP20 family molecular chaperone IbpA